MTIEAKSLGWLVRPEDAVTVEQSGPSFGQIAMPDLIGLLRNVDTMQLPTPSLIK